MLKQQTKHSRHLVPPMLWVTPQPYLCCAAGGSADMNIRSFHIDLIQPVRYHFGLQVIPNLGFIPV